MPTTNEPEPELEAEPEPEVDHPENRIAPSPTLSAGGQPCDLRTFLILHFGEKHLDQGAGFAAHARSKGLGPILDLSLWRAELARFLESPIR